MKIKTLLFVVFTLLPIRMLASDKDYRNYHMAGPFSIVARDGKYAYTKGGSERDMMAALQCAKLGIEDKSCEIINAYADSLQCFGGHDAPLCTGQAYWLLRAMTLMKKHQKPSWAAMVRRAILPTIEKFDADSPYANGNWGAIVNRARLASAIFLADSTLYKQAVDYYMHANDNGSLPKYILPSGQCQETGRDQAHVQLGLEALAQTAEMAWEQGTDLWGAYDNLLMRGFEYTAKYNLGYDDVPYEQWSDCTGLYCNWSEPGAINRGKMWDIYQLPYSHYVETKHLDMPYTKRVLELQDKAEQEGKSREVKVAGVEEAKSLDQIVTWGAPKGAPLKSDYDVFVMPRNGKEWKRIDTYMAKVNAPTADGKHRVSSISYAMVDFKGFLFVRVVAKNRKFNKARIRPDYHGTIANVKNDSTVEFMLFQPENVSVELDGDITSNLLLFTSKPAISKEEARKQAKRQRRKFISYAPGFYNDKDTIRIPSNTTVYLEGGSYFTSTFAIDDAENVSILGRGIARPESGYEGCQVSRSKNVLIDGLVVNTCPVGGSSGVTLHDVRCISHPSWGDGLNVFASSDVLYDRVFCRTSDDCTTAYGTRKGFTGSVNNVRMTNSILWADAAHPIFIGLHGNAEEGGDSITNLRYDNIDILCQSEPQVDYQGCLAINCSDNNYVKNVVFDNIRIEQINQGCILQVKVSWNDKYCKAPGKGVEDITFRNIRYYGKTPYMSIINGYDDNRKVKNVVFESFKINGQTICDDMPCKLKWHHTSDFVPMYVGNHVEGIVFKK